MSISILDDNHYDFISSAFTAAQKEIRLISPFIQNNAARLLVDSLQGNSGLSCTIITRFYREDFIQSASSLKALSDLVGAGVQVYAVLNLHTKLYLFDKDTAIVGSANFTNGGLKTNIELSLALEDEPYAIERLSLYFSDLVNAVREQGDFRITKELLDQEVPQIRELIKRRNVSDKPNRKRFGAQLHSEPLAETPDPVEQILSAATHVYGESKAVLKFEGQAGRRLDRNDKYTPNYNEFDNYFFTCSPFFPGSLTPDKTLYMTAISYDKRGHGVPIIVGRAKTYGADRANISDDKMRQAYSWTSDFPYYIKIYDIEIVDAPIGDCVVLLDLIQDIGANLYPSTIGEEVSIESLRARHHRKSYIHITPAASHRIDQLLEMLFQKHGKAIFTFN